MQETSITRYDTCSSAVSLLPPRGSSSSLPSSALSDVSLLWFAACILMARKCETVWGSLCWCVRCAGVFVVVVCSLSELSGVWTQYRNFMYYVSVYFHFLVFHPVARNFLINEEIFIQSGATLYLLLVKVIAHFSSLP